LDLARLVVAQLAVAHSVATSALSMWGAALNAVPQRSPAAMQLCSIAVALAYPQAMRAWPIAWKELPALV